jgi:hypothetical protein
MELKENSLAQLCSILKEAFQKCFKNWGNTGSKVKKVEASTSKGTKPKSSRVSEKMIYLIFQNLYGQNAYIYISWFMNLLDTHEEDTKYSPQMVLRTLNMCVLEFCVGSGV